MTETYASMRDHTTNAIILTLTILVVNCIISLIFLFESILDNTSKESNKKAHELNPIVAAECANAGLSTISQIERNIGFIRRKDEQECVWAMPTCEMTKPDGTGEMFFSLNMTQNNKQNSHAPEQDEIPNEAINLMIADNIFNEAINEDDLQHCFFSYQLNEDQSIMLPTMRVLMKIGNTAFPVNAGMDTRFSQNIISKKILLKFAPNYTSMNFNEHIPKVKGTAVIFKERNVISEEIEVTLEVMREINIQQLKINREDFADLNQLPLADEKYDSPKEIDIIFGSEFAKQIFLPLAITNNKSFGSFKTKLGFLQRKKQGEESFP